MKAEKGESEMQVNLIAYTQVSDEFLNTILTYDYEMARSIADRKIPDGQAVALTAIRCCYSPNKPSEIVGLEGEKYFKKAATDGEGGTDADRLFRHIVNSGHTSTLEHLSFTFAIEGVSRALLAQLTRHRVGFSYSVQSQRYTKAFKDEAQKEREKCKKYSNNSKRTPFNKLTIGEEHQVVDLYKDGYSTIELGKMFKVSPQTISNILKEYGIALRSNNESVVDHSFFEEIDTPDKAHLLGWIASDGCLIERDKNGYKFKSISIKVQKNDKEILEQIKTVLSAKNGLTDLDSENSSQLIINSKRLYDSLIDKGITPRKSLTIGAFEIFNKVPKHLWGDVFLGIFEGDGSFGVYSYVDKRKGKTYIKPILTISSGSERFLNQLKQIVAESCDVTGGRIRSIKNGFSEGSSYQLIWQSKKDIEKIARWMYKNLNLEFCLKRKLKLFFENVDDVKELVKHKFLEVADQNNFVAPEKVLNNFDALVVMLDYFKTVRNSYINLYVAGLPQEDARSVLGNGYKTNLVMTANLRALLDFYSKRRKGRGAQWEIAELAEQLRKAVVEVEPWTDAFFEQA